MTETEEKTEKKDGGRTTIAVIKAVPLDVNDLVEPEPVKRSVIENDLPFFTELLRHPYLLPELVPFGNDLAVPVTDAVSLAQIQERMNQLVNMPVENTRLPGPNPVSLRRQDIPSLYNLDYGPYWFSYKADGIRWWLLITRMYQEVRVVAINRAKRCLYLPLPVPEDFAEGTLIDGELVQCRPEHGGQYQYVFFDVVTARGVPCFRRSFTYNKRLRHIGKGVEEDLRTALSMAKETAAQQPLRYAFPVIAKPMVQMAESREFVEKVVPTVPYKMDGYVMSPNCDRIRFGQHPRMFKLKNIMDCTGDFQCILQTPKPGEPSFFDLQRPIAAPFKDPEFAPHVAFVKIALWCATNDGSRLLYYTYSFVTEGLLQLLDRKSIAELHNAKLACRYDSVRGLWVPIEVLKDRNAPNALNTIQRLLENIQENIQLEEVLPPPPPPPPPPPI